MKPRDEWGPMDELADIILRSIMVAPVIAVCVFGYAWAKPKYEKYKKAKAEEAFHKKWKLKEGEKDTGLCTGENNIVIGHSVYGNGPKDMSKYELRDPEDENDN